MKFFMKSRNPKSDPRSEGFIQSVVVMLGEKGIAEKNAQAQCARAMLNVGIKMMKTLQTKAKPGQDNLEHIRNYTEQMKVVVKGYGITDEELQEDVVVAFFERLEKARVAI